MSCTHELTFTCQQILDLSSCLIIVITHLLVVDSILKSSSHTATQHVITLLVDQFNT